MFKSKTFSELEPVDCALSFGLAVLYAVSAYISFKDGMWWVGYVATSVISLVFVTIGAVGLHGRKRK